jgi:hypothetical protein
LAFILQSRAEGETTFDISIYTENPHLLPHIVAVILCSFNVDHPSSHHIYVHPSPLDDMSYPHNINVVSVPNLPYASHGWKVFNANDPNFESLPSTKGKDEITSAVFSCFGKQGRFNRLQEGMITPTTMLSFLEAV